MVIIIPQNLDLESSINFCNNINNDSEEIRENYYTYSKDMLNTGNKNIKHNNSNKNSFKNNSYENDINNRKIKVEDIDTKKKYLVQLVPKDKYHNGEREPVELLDSFIRDYPPPILPSTMQIVLSRVFILNIKLVIKLLKNNIDIYIRMNYT